MSKNILTKREKEVFNLLILNKSTKEIASTLNISDSKTTFNNTPIKVEPNAYSLIFIMKYKDLD